jgi:branched-chain amino acid transport system permease protein
MLAAAFASIAGSFDAYYVHYISPDSYNITFSIILVTGVIIGGLGTIWGAFWGTVAIVVLPEILKRVSEDITNLVFGVLLIAIMIFWQGRTQSLGRYARALLLGRRHGDDARGDAGKPGL